MIETPEAFITELLEAISGWGSTAGRELGEAIGNPSNLPIFLSSLVKFSLGPTLAFMLSQQAFRSQEKWKEERDTEALRLMTKLEVEGNLKDIKRMLNSLQDRRERYVKTYGEDMLPSTSLSEWATSSFKHWTPRRHFFEVSWTDAARTFTKRELSILNGHYSSLEIINRLLTDWSEGGGYEGLLEKGYEHIHSILYVVVRMNEDVLKALETGQPPGVKSEIDRLE